MSETPTLQELVNQAAHRRQASARHLSKIAQDHGFKIVYTTLSQLQAGTYKSQPRDETLRAIAWLAGVHEDVAFAAAGRPTPGPPFADELPPGVDYLPPKARRSAIEMLRTLVEMNKPKQEQEIPSQVQRNEAPTSEGLSSVKTQKKAQAQPLQKRRLRERLTDRDEPTDRMLDNL
ncbi:hypothetical protein [Acaricomes phytoseiuli]|uniref:hypothetical protein n=1 Tax=Acaricomes phytoseiuli TaxID=291968 RepID=UPI0012EAF834|nr:hypothetical protein [Acaricomes phytoseiuli]